MIYNSAFDMRKPIKDSYKKHITEHLKDKKFSK